MQKFTTFFVTIAVLFCYYQGIGAQPLPDDFPTITTEIFNEEALGDGKIFVAIRKNNAGVGTYLILLENDGTPFWYKKLEDSQGFNFMVQPNGLMTYGYEVDPIGFSGGSWVVNRLMDKQFNVVDSFDMLNGYRTESHCFQMLPNGHILMETYALEPFDLTEYGGYPYAQIAGTIIQELDAEKKLVNQWRFFDEFDLSVFNNRTLTREVADAVHTNSIDVDIDGHFIISSRGIAMCTKINRQTGEVMWNLGGKLNDFSYIGADSAVINRWFNGHDFRRLPNGHFSYFVNNRTGGTSNTSKVAEFILDEENFTCELVWLYEPAEPVNAMAMGNAQKLPNGNYFIGWGTASRQGGPVGSEITANKDTLFNLRWDESALSYRSFRFDLNTDIPSDSVTLDNVTTGEWDFISGDTITGITIDITNITDGGSNALTVSVFDYASVKPIFAGKDPMAMQKRVVLEGQGITSIGGNILFDTATFGITNPGDITIYHRETVGEGEFLPLTTTYIPGEGKIEAVFDQFGEFMITYPDLPSVPYPPNPFRPADGQPINQDSTVRVEWSPRGFITDFSLQIATDETFSNLVVDENGLPNPVYEFTPSDNETYYWRVSTTNEGGTSEWSDTAMFSSVEPFINIVAPELNENLDPGLDYIFTWESNLNEDFVVRLMAADTLFGVLDTTSRLKYYEWEVPPDINLASHYRIVVSKLDTSVSDTSDVFSILDLTAPVAVCMDTTIYLDETGMFTIDSTYIDGGSTDEFSIASIIPSVTEFDCDHIGENLISVVVTDIHGNTDTCEATITVLDTIPPVASCNDITRYKQKDEDVTIEAADINYNSSDACGEVTMDIDISSFTCDDIGENTVVLTVTDESGNSDSCEAVVTLLDTSSACATAVDPLDAISAVRVYPNPAQDWLSISYEVRTTTDIEIKMYDILGKEVRMICNERTLPGVYKISIDLTGLDGRSYILSLRSDADIRHHKILIMK